MSDLTPEAREELARLAAQATPGPWTADGLEGVLDSPDSRVLDGITSWWEADAQYIAATDPDTVKALLAQITRQETELDYWMSRAYGAEQEALRAEKRVQAVRDVHHPAHNDLERTPFCQGCKGAPGVHECGCWQDEQQTPVCAHCRGWKGAGPIDWPCPTIRALDGTVTPPAE